MSVHAREQVRPRSSREWLRAPVLTGRKKEQAELKALAAKGESPRQLQKCQC